MEPGVVILIVIGVIGLIILIVGLVTRCPNCKKWWKRKLTSKVELDRVQTTKTVTHYDIQRDSSGNEIGRTERKETVPVTRIKYRCHYTCKNCGHSWTNVGWEES